MIKEACVGSISEALLAEKCGANRIELCDNLSEGGTTPSYGTIKQAIHLLNIPILVMIRPRGNDFCYSEAEINTMLEDIKICKQLGVPGVVFGALTKEKELDLPALTRLVKEAKPMKITFHKAIDEMENPLKAIPSLIDLGIDRILSSGKEETALEGQEMLNQMIQLAKSHITIVAAGKVTSDNLELCSEKIHTEEFHGKQIVSKRNS